jgi:hypothetical protein
MPLLSLSATVRASDDVVFRELEGESVLLNLATGVYFGLDEVGTRIWQLIEQHGRLLDVRDAMTREFDVDADTAGRDLSDLVAQMSGRGLVEVEP